MTESGRTCARCQTWRAADAFSKDRRYKSGLQAYCKDCMKAYRAENRERIDARIRAAKAADPDKYLDQKLRRTYGITLTDYRAMEAAQGGCAICGDTPSYSLHVDHDHSTGLVRGLLCSRCNTALGKFRDDEDLLRKAITYLNEH